MSVTDAPVNFSTFDFVPELNEALTKIEFVVPTPIQAEAIPIILQKKDVAGLAQTGTGKTAAFLLPLIDRIFSTLSSPPGERAFDCWGQRNYCLILVPTRELAEQISEAVETFGGEKIKAAVVIGGKGYEGQIQKIRSGVDFIVATPGRLIDLYKEKNVDLSFVKACVFDEADRMFDMGFKEDMVYLLNRIPSDRQLLMFSATMNFDVLNVAYEFGSEPVEVNIDRDQPRAENVQDEVFHVGSSDKPKYLLSLIKRYNPDQAIVFSNFKRNIPKIEKFLIENKVKSLGISSSLNQNQRQRVMSQFKGGEVKILVATDVAARGLDIEGVDMVVNFELPDDAENYVHRIGRTGRAGKKGVAVSLSSDKDVEALSRIEDYLDEKVTVGWLEEEDFIEEFEAFDYRFDPNEQFEKVKKDTRNREHKKFDKNRDRPRKSSNSRVKDKQSSSKGSSNKNYSSSNKVSDKGSSGFTESRDKESAQSKYEGSFRQGKLKGSKKKLENRRSEASKNLNSQTSSKKGKSVSDQDDRYKGFKTRKRVHHNSSTSKEGIVSKVKSFFSGRS